jgi:hypothetical protein
MARDESENFRIRPGRSRNGGARINPRTQPFLKQVQIAVRKAGGGPQRMGSASGREGGRTGRFNARGRGEGRFPERAGAVAGSGIPLAASARPNRPVRLVWRHTLGRCGHIGEHGAARD